MELRSPERHLCGRHSHREVRGWHLTVHGNVEQVTHVAIEPGLFEEFTPTSVTKALALLDAASGEHAVVPTFRTPPDHEHPVAVNDDRC
ncbi:hypothetical protein NS263_02510 [Curtobacterium oceanosedimentum]|uniref:Uncharacterized protein n=1 Tax=Curtobacterium oceanosedimentum TaxID=465820 RepID=A0ABR5S9A1_9MICO|nr:hypothetical protein NS263_02510 [Curtobacterium oceanosedimentum]